MKKVIGSLCAVISLYLSCTAQSLPVIRATDIRVSIRENGEFLKDYWRVSSDLKPDVHAVGVKGNSTWVAFITDIDSIGFTVKPGDKYSFIILLNNKDTALTEIQGERFIEPALFTEDYIKEHNGNTFTEIPEVYELANIVFALTPADKKDQYAVEKGNDYYKDVVNWFDEYSNDSLVIAMDTLVKRGYYAQLKMDSYAFEFNSTGEIIQSRIYDRVSWGKQNTLRRFIPQLQSFASKSRFREFFEKHKTWYDAQIKAYRDSINTKEMVKWLNRNFPGTRYNSFKIIWSPLVAGNQSANWFKNNGFTEAQQHVNFPYHYWYKGFSKEAIDLKRGNIVFTEMNHAFINPEGAKEQYSNDISKAFNNLLVWGEKERAAAWYPNAYSMFNEYMNWVLVSLRYVDYAPKSELDSLIKDNERYMTKGRGFIRFDKFNQFVVNLYKTRNAGQTVADLYPMIMDWFKDNNIE